VGFLAYFAMSLVENTDSFNYVFYLFIYYFELDIVCILVQYFRALSATILKEGIKMSDRTVMFVTGGICFIGKQKNGKIENICMVTFTPVNTANGPVQLAFMNKVGTMENSEAMFPLIGMDRDSNLYRDYLKLTTGIDIAGPGAIPPTHN
jgi:hypothetical protein